MPNSSATLESLNDKIANCTRCTFCKWVPEVKSEAFAEICPSVQHGKFFSHTAGGKLIAAYSLLHGKTGYTENLIDNIYSCSMCGGCDTSCKTLFAEHVEPLNSLYALRQRVVSDGQAPEPLKVVLQHLRQTGNPFGCEGATRGDWATGLDLKQTKTHQAPFILHVGDAAFEPHQWSALHHVARRMNAAGVNFVIGGVDEPDTGGLAFDIGDQQLATTLAQRTLAWLEKSNAETLVVYGDDSFSAFRNIYPRLGLALGKVRIVHIAQWLAQHPSNEKADCEKVRVTYHDSCRLGRLGEEHKPWAGKMVLAYNSIPIQEPAGQLQLGGGGVYEEPRKLLADANAELVEMERIREFAFCCGAGGGGAQANPEFARAAARHRLQEAESTGAEFLVSSCSSCSHHLKQVAEQEGSSLKIVGLVEFLQHRETAPIATAASHAGE